MTDDTDTSLGMIEFTVTDIPIPDDDPARTDFETEMEWVVKEALEEAGLTEGTIKART